MSIVVGAAAKPSGSEWRLPNGQTMEDIMKSMELRKIMTGPNRKVQYWVPPAWTNPDYKPPNSFTPTLVFSFICAVVGTAMVAFRIITTQRTRPTRLLYLEDWLILAGLGCLLGLCAFAVVGRFKWQFGSHSYDMHWQNLVWNYTVAYIWYIINLWATCIIRASLILTIRRIYSPLNTRLLRVCDVLLVCKILVAIGGTIGITFACGSSLGVLDIYKFNPQQCNPYISMTTLCAVLLVMDLVIIILPMPLVRMLANVARKRKFEVLFIFSLGFLAVAASVVRLVEVVRYFHTFDKNWIASYLILTSLLDLTLALVTSCIPSARILFRQLYSERSLFSLDSYFSRIASPEPISASVTAKTPNARIRKAGRRKASGKAGATPASKRMKSFLSKASFGSNTATASATVTTDTCMSGYSCDKGEGGDFGKFDFDLEKSPSNPEHPDYVAQGSRRPTVASITRGESERKGSVSAIQNPPSAYTYHHKRQSRSSNALPITHPPSLQEDLSIRSVRNSHVDGLGMTWYDDKDDDTTTATPGDEEDVGELSSDDEDQGAGTTGVEQYYEGDREFLIPCPSDSFFPYATALRPAPPRRAR